MLVVDGFATFFRILVMSVGILAILPSYGFLARQDAETSEYHAAAALLHRRANASWLPPTT